MTNYAEAGVRFESPIAHRHYKHTNTHCLVKLTTFHQPHTENPSQVTWSLCIISHTFLIYISVFLLLLSFFFLSHRVITLSTEQTHNTHILNTRALPSLPDYHSVILKFF